MWFFIFQSVALLSVACAFGVFAGWLFWGGNTAPTGSASESGFATPDVTAKSRVAIAADLDARTADVARLRQKLKRAVVELERRSGQLVAVREEHETLQMHLDALSSQLVSAGVAVPAGLVQPDPVGHIQPLVDDHEPAASDHLAMPADVAIPEGADSLDSVGPVEALAVDATEATGMDWDRRLEEERATHRAALHAQIAESERLLAENEVRAHDLRARADAAEAEVAALQASLVALERESEGRLAALELDLSSARLRADAAARELVSFSAELKVLRDANTSYVESTQTTMEDLQARLDGASSALSGRVGSKTATDEPTSGASLYELVSLPGMSHELAAQLRDIGVRSVADIAGWTADDVERFQAWLPDHPGVIARNEWVDVARMLVAEAEASPEGGGGADASMHGVFFDARSHSEVGG